MSELKHQLNFDNTQDGDYLNEFMPPEQRLDAVAEILATIGLRVMQKMDSDRPNETNLL